MSKLDLKFLRGVDLNSIPFVNSIGNVLTSSTFVFDGSNVGIGTATPTAKLHVDGSVRLSSLTTTPTAGYVLQSTDVDGNADWVDVNTLVTGGATDLNGLSDVTTGLPLTPTLADDGKILFYDFDATQWTTDDSVTHGTVVINAKKSTAGTIAKGTPVYLVGFDADLHTVEAANAGSSTTMPVIGFAGETIDNTNSKHIISFGKITGIDTTSTGLLANGETWAINDALYVDSVTGELTNVRPTGATTEIQRVAKVLRVDAAGGQLFIFNTARTAGLPNLSQDNVWLGNSDNQPIEATKTSLGIYAGSGTLSANTSVDMSGSVLNFTNSGPATSLINSAGSIIIDRSLTSSYLEVKNAGSLRFQAGVDSSNYGIFKMYSNTGTLNFQGRANAFDYYDLNGGNLIWRQRFSSASSFQIIDMTNNNEFNFSNNGGFGIGVTPTAKLHVKGSGSTSATTSLLVENSLGTDLLTVKDDGNVGIGTATPTEKLHVDGTVRLSSLTTTPAAGYLLQSIDALGNLDWVAPSGSDGNGIFDAANDDATLSSNFGFRVADTLTVKGVTGAGLVTFNTAQGLNIGNGTTSANLIIDTQSATPLSIKRAGVELVKVTYNGANPTIKMYDQSAVQRVNINCEAFAGDTYFNHLGNTGFGLNNPTAKLHVKTPTSAGSNNALLVQNNLVGGTDLLTVKDDGQVWSNGRGGVATNTAFGKGTLSSSTTGGFNSVFGEDSGSSILSAAENVALGFRAMYSVSATQVGGNNVAIGSNVGNGITSGISNVFIGDDAANSSAAGSYSVFLGRLAGASASGNYGVGIGIATLQNVTGSSNIAIGQSALKGLAGSTGFDNIVLGNSAMANATLTGSDNVAIGRNVAFSSTSNSRNVFIGRSSAQSTLSGNNNTYLGYFTGFDNVSGSNNVFLGALAGRYETGSEKLFIDNQARTDEATSRTSSLIYGEFNATVSSQVLSINAGTVRLSSLPTTPSPGDVLQSVDANGNLDWVTPSSGGAAKYSQQFNASLETVGVAKTITHSLGTTSIIVQLWDDVTGELIDAKFNNKTTNTVDITFVGALPSGNVTIIILG